MFSALRTIALGVTVVLLLAVLTTATTTWATADPAATSPGTPSSDSDQVVPSNHARSSLHKVAGGAATPTVFGGEARTIDGTGNNVANPTWGSAGIQLLRLAPSDYADGFSTPAGPGRPSARAVSNAVSSQDDPIPNPVGASDMVWQWGQFLDHDLDLAEIADPAEPFPVPVPIGDPFFDPMSTGTQTIDLDRAAYDPVTGTAPGNPRQQMNFITSFIDASNVYGSDPVRADALRRLDGTGKLKTSAGELLPFNVGGLPNAGGPSPTLFLAGDVRSNEQVGLTAMHTLFVREHNRLCDEILAAEPGLSGEDVYQRARAIVGAQMQVITYNEFLPLLLGPNALPPYQGYSGAINPGVSNMFATAGYRLGHSMLSGLVHRLDGDNNEISEGHLALRDAFFSPDRLSNEGGIEPLLRGLAHKKMQQIDGLVIDDVRNFLFGPPGSGGLDLASLNIQRGRDHGLPSYNDTRVAFGLAAVTTFAQISSDPVMQSRLQDAYATVDSIDVWVGSLCEDHLPGALVGPTLMAVLKDQFERLRDGDRFWYQEVFSGDELAELENTRLSDIIRRNTTIDDEIQDNVFVAPLGAAIPATSQWGLKMLALLVAITATLLYCRRAHPSHTYPSTGRKPGD